MKRALFDADHDAFRAAVREFVVREVEPNQERWDDERLVDRGTWLAAGKQGFLGMHAPEEHGGGGLADYRFRCVLTEELARVGAASVTLSFALQNDVFLPYVIDLATDEQLARWLPGLTTGETIGAIAMTEPGAGSDLQGLRATAVRDGDAYVLNGAKTFITNGIHADLVIVVARTYPDAGSRGMSLLMVERGMPGFERGRKLAKIGLHAQDTAELSFDVRVPVGNLLGTEGGAFGHLMERLPTERLSLAYQAYAATRAALAWTVDYTRGRKAFGTPVAGFQNTAFALAELTTDTDVLEAYLDKSVLALNAGELTDVDAAKCKLAATALQKRAIDQCLQFFGGYGCMTEYPIARAYLDARAQSIYGGSSEIMKTIIARDVTGLR